jgi:hypothetical protein
MLHFGREILHRLEDPRNVDLAQFLVLNRSGSLDELKLGKECFHGSDLVMRTSARWLMKSTGEV